MSGRSFFRMMMGLVLCLMMQLPVLFMPAAMAGVPAAGTVMAGRGQPAGGAVRPVATPPDRLAGMEDMMLAPLPVARHAGMAGAPCCQNHHGLCDAGWLPGRESCGAMRVRRAVGCRYGLRLDPQSLVVPPWRPPAVLPV